MADLKDVFLAFAAIGAGATKPADMDSKNFLKLCKDAKLVDSKFLSTHVDLIFTQVKAKTARRINFAEFESAVQKIAAQKGISKEDVEAKIKAASPNINATQAEFVKFHDDKNTYTGVYAKGGPTNVDKDKITLSSHLDRSPADKRGVKI
eukprot:CAMPEP_0202900958 /NCGR_PEP_ID=MMETSP1392-20130828/12388_1 /ASSEMBLY_ACC=CAM_ASM_000868 /TAXON_ID=225041 /ORGANISM="Chlamydomonas chlamydogama, Strain SAG 11-48b" /LENGTH=149 /DNA_ID=CAMNT_0049587427 /DNA_START=49 /DNA_END=498 /DNA_ORIENTATION=+